MAISIGDVYIISYFGQGTASGSNTSPEGFAIIVKNPIAAGEVLSFTDAALQSNGTFGTNEQTINFTVPAGGIAANTVLQFPLNGGNTTNVYANDGQGGRTSIGTITPTGNTGLSNSGDQIFAFQGTLAQPTVLAGIDVADGSPITTGTTSTNTTYAPTNGAPFLDLPKGSNNAQIAIDPTTATPAQLTDVANYTQNIATTTNPESSFASIACFAAGTLIRIARGDVPVEKLVVGDLVVTASGALRPIRWLGHRVLDCRRFPRPQQALPIRIAAHAFGEHRPARDLHVSPAHAICVDVVGEVLIPAGKLVNGSTIRQVNVDQVTYWHLELDSHDVILAENLAADSYIEWDNRGFFTEAEVVDLAAGPDPQAREQAELCRPWVDSGPLLDVVRAQLASRAVASAVEHEDESAAA